LLIEQVSLKSLQMNNNSKKCFPVTRIPCTSTKCSTPFKPVNPARAVIRCSMKNQLNWFSALFPFPIPAKINSITNEECA